MGADPRAASSSPRISTTTARSTTQALRNDRPAALPARRRPVFVKFVVHLRLARGRNPWSAARSHHAASSTPAACCRAGKAHADAGDEGGDTSFRLPENAGAGEIRAAALHAYRGNVYSAAFAWPSTRSRAEITLVPDKAGLFKVGEPVAGRLQLAMPTASGGGLRRRADDRALRKLTMVDGDLGYYGQFPVKLESETYLSLRREGRRPLLPARLTEPSRYVIPASPPTAPRCAMKTTEKELLVERSRRRSRCAPIASGARRARGGLRR